MKPSTWSASDADGRGKSPAAEEGKKNVHRRILAEAARWAIATLMIGFVIKGTTRYLEYRSARLRSVPALPSSFYTSRCDVPPSGRTTVEGALPGRLNVNRASREELEKLPGIGPVLADEIVRYREVHGPFTKVEDLLILRNMGAKKFARLAPLICAQ